MPLKNRLTPDETRKLKRGDLLIYRPGIWQQLVRFEKVIKDLGTDYVFAESVSGLPNAFQVPTADNLINHQEVEITRRAIFEIKSCSYCSSDINKGWIIEKSVGNVEGYCDFNCGIKKGYSEVAFLKNAYHMNWSGTGTQAILFE